MKVMSYKILYFILFCIASVLISGCIHSSLKNVTFNNSSEKGLNSGDFIIHISQNGLNDPIRTISLNYSEVITRNYRDIPVLLDLSNTSYCSYSLETNFSTIAALALSDEKIQNILKNGGIVKGIYVWGPPSYTKEQSDHACAYVYPTLELEYKTKGITALVNETSRTVILPSEY